MKQITFAEEEKFKMEWDIYLFLLLFSSNHIYMNYAVVSS